MELAKNWPKIKPFKIFLVIISFILLLICCFINISSITDGNFSKIEVESISSAINGKLILKNPLNLPYKLAIYLCLKLGLTSVFMLRAVVAVFGVMLALLFYSLLKKWFSAKIAWLATAMMVSSSLFLNYNRLAVPSVLMPLGLLGLLWATWWIHQSNKINFHILLAAIIVISCFYVPGMIWFILLLVLFQKKHITNFYRKTSKSTLILAISISIFLLLPLLRALALNPVLIKSWLALPNQLDLTILIKELIIVPISLIAKAPLNPVFNLGRLPYLDILTFCLSVLGIYAFSKRYKLMRTRALTLTIIITWILIGFNNNTQINIILPLIYITVCAGIMFLLQQWFSVFPKNPIARTAGIILLSGVISLSLYYNFTRYFVAWANNPISQNAFEIKNPTNLLQ